MAEEETQTQSIQARIAALNLGQVGKAPVTAKPNNLALRPAQKPTIENRRNSTNIPAHRNASSQHNEIGNEPTGRSVISPPIITRSGQKAGSSESSSPAPRLPPRRTSTQKSPALPPRRPSEQLSRRDSTESVSSVVSSVSTFSNGSKMTLSTRTPSMDRSRVRAPVYDPSTLPPLPPKRSQQEKEKDTTRIPLKGAKSSPSVTTMEILPPPSAPAVPQRLPSHDRSREPVKKLPPKDPPPMPARTLTSSMTNGYINGRDPSPTPPPVPMSSRPDISRIMATKPKMPAISSSTPSISSSITCLKCRDFSGPDNHAAKFPRQSVPSLDWLAVQLTDPFPSPTDKARSIFTWLHHNVDYDVAAFFGNCVQPSTPASTLSTGLAVCEGYAGLFTVLAVKAGLEAITIGGHGKGFGNQPIPPGAPVPPETSNHAWNAFKDDLGYWKLIDSCWGAGNISGPGRPYNRDFTPKHFTDDNAVFSLRHFPTNRAHAFINPPMSWQEYILGDQGGEHVQVYSNIAPREGLSSIAFLPKYKRIPVSHSSQIHFQFQKVCSHWDPLVQGLGKPFVYVLATGIAKDGRASGEYIPFETDGMVWWLDIDARHLGRSGDGVCIYTVETVGGASGRGLSKQDYLAAKGRKGMGFGGVATWELI